MTDKEYWDSLNWKGKLQYLWYYYSYDPFGLSWRLDDLSEWAYRNEYMIGRAIAAILFALAGMILFLGFLV